MSDTPELPEDEETEHEKRKRQLSLHDPIHSVSLKDYTFQELTKCQSQYGPNMFHQLMETVDPDIAQQLQDFIQVQWNVCWLQ